MTEILYIGVPLAIILGIVGAYDGALREACLKIGRRLVNASEGTGVQDAITPPSLTNRTMFNWIATLALLAGVVYFVGWGSAAIVAGVRVLTRSVFGAAMINEPPRPHFVGRVYALMLNRHADYLKANDSVRAEMMKDLIDRFEESEFIDMVVHVPEEAEDRA